ncbi:BEN domain-containing protein 5 [Ixodes scapularis]|uniref:BEN domain-containing protein 5 n=1 Tax=Ixodes scapularis TaxID=6945 RepID=UPI001C38E09E|nr:BEN domain-containing protein 5 [Ixodes scapularis]
MHPRLLRPNQTVHQHQQVGKASESRAMMVNASQAPASQPTHPPAPASGDGESGATMVDIGCHILIPSKKWEDLHGLMVDSRFTKEAATSIWGADILKGKSPTGRLSNKAKALGHTEAFPPLTPEKVDVLRSFFISRLTDKGIPMEQAVKRAKLIRKFLSEKCTDARR